MINLNTIRNIAKLHPNNLAIATPDQLIDWQEFSYHVDSVLANLLKNYDVQKIKRAAFIAENSYELVVLMAAFSTLRIPLVGIDYTLSTEYIQHMLNEIDVNCLLVSDKFKNKIHTPTPFLIAIDSVIFKPQSIHSTATNLHDLPARTFESISFTSGTSGYPKAVLRTFSFDAQRFQYLNERYGFNEYDKHLVTLPFYHVSATGWARLFLTQGAGIVLADIYRPAELYSAIIKYRVTTSLFVPHVLAELVDLASLPDSPQFNSLRFIIVGGKHFPVDLKIKALQRLGPIIHEYYGSTETGINTLADPEDLLMYPESVGKAFTGNLIHIVDDKYHSLPCGETGRIAIHSYMNMSNYFSHKPDEITLQENKFILMPDHGYLDQQQRLYVTNRLANTLRVTQTINIYELEDELRKLPCVKDAVVISEAFTNNISHIKCAVVPNNGIQPTQAYHSAKNILQAKGLIISCLKTLKELPYSLSGKIKQQELKKILQSN